MACVLVIFHAGPVENIVMDLFVRRMTLRGPICIGHKISETGNKMFEKEKEGL